VDEEDARLSPTTPIEEMDPIARLDDHHEAIRFGCGIRRRHGFHRP
jgi:hypothetical protein